MAGTQTQNQTLVTITPIHAMPINKTEADNAHQLVVGALQGTWGSGTWDGGIGGAGQWEKHSNYWDASLQADISGAVTVTFPYLVVNSIVDVSEIDLSTNIATNKSFYVANSRTLPLSFVGRIIVTLVNVKNSKG